MKWYKELLSMVIFMKAKKNLAIGIFVFILGMWMLTIPTGNFVVDIVLPSINIFMAGCNFMLFLVLNFLEKDKKRRKK